MSQLKTKHLLGIKNLDREDIELIFQTAINFKEVINRPIKKVPSLRDVTVANIFFENSTRTKLSFELAEKRLSADVINFSASGSSVKKGESFLIFARLCVTMHTLNRQTLKQIKFLNTLQREKIETSR